MRGFLWYIIRLLISVIVLLYLFDATYTYIYENGVSRDKIRWVNSVEMPDSVDYILLGSSRCLNTLIPAVIYQSSGKKGVNLGCSGAGMVEIKLMLKEALKNIKFRKVFIQVDTKYDQVTPDRVASVAWMPYIHNNDIYREYSKYGNEFSAYRHLPFYRYMHFDSKIGIRNVSLILLKKKGNFVKRDGFVPLFGVKHNNRDLYFKSMSGKENPIAKEIIKICNDNNLELFFFTAPIFNSIIDFSLLNRFLPSYKDFSQVINEKKYFKDSRHLNNEGARLFSVFFANTYFGNRSD